MACSLLKCSQQTMRRYIAFAVACLCMALVGSYLLMSIMSANMQMEYNLSQTAVEVIVGVGSACGNIGYPWGLVLEHMSERAAYMISMLMGSTCAFALYAGDFYIHYYGTNWWLLAILWGGVCSSFVISYLISTAVSLANFPRNQHGRVMGILAVVWSLGQAFFNWMYTITQQHHPPRIGMIFFVLGICIFLFKSLAIVFVHPIPLDEEETRLIDDEKKVDGKEESKEEENEEAVESWSDKLGLYLLSDLDFHLMLWGFVAGVSVQMMYISNVSTTCETLGLGIIDEAILPYAPIFGMAVTFITGFLSDVTLKYCPRQSYMAGAAAMQTILFAVSCVYAENETMFKLTVLLVFGFNAIYYALAGTIISDYFGMKHFKRNWGITMMIGSLVAFLLVTLYGTMMDMTERGGSCYGLICLKNIFRISTILSFISFGALVWLHRRFWIEKRKAVQNVTD